MKQLIDRFLAGITRKRDIAFFYNPKYECETVEKHTKTHGIVTKRGKRLLSHLLRENLIDLQDVRLAPWVGLSVLALVHTPEYLESLESAQTLGKIFGLKANQVNVDELVAAQRHGVGGTVMAVKAVLKGGKKIAINVGGGFHSAGPEKGSGFCAYNDVAVTIAKLRKDGFKENIAVIDLDFHFGKGNTEALKKDKNVLLYSINSPEWSPVRKGKYEYEMPEDATDLMYLKKLQETLPKALKAHDPKLIIFIAGSDVLHTDPFGAFEMTMDGVYERDKLIVDWARDHNVPLVITLAGGYSLDACQSTANLFAYVLNCPEQVNLERDTQFHKHFKKISKSLNHLELQKEKVAEDEFSFTEDDLFGDSKMGSKHKVLDYYSAYGVELALERYGIFAKIRKRGYHDLEVAVDASDPSHQLIRVSARHEDEDQHRKFVLGEVVLRKLTMAPPKSFKSKEKLKLISIEWLMMQDPRAPFSDKRKHLPGQEHPGLGLGAEIQEVFVQMCMRLKMDGVALHPSHYHIGLGASALFHFLDPKTEGRFRAMREVLKKKELAWASACVDQKRLVMKNGKKLEWVPGDQVHAVSERLKNYFDSAQFEQKALDEKYRLLKGGLHIGRKPKRLKKSPVGTEQAAT